MLKLLGLRPPRVFSAGKKILSALTLFVVMLSMSDLAAGEHATPGSLSTAVSYDRHSLIINGQRTLLISGAVHYPRSTPEMWPRILKESKAAGLNCIETYVFWEGHERQEGTYDFSGRFDLPRFLDMCKENDLYVILRVGPYICAEWNYGGLPWWMAGRPGLVTRTWNEPFMQAMESWVMELGRQVADRQIDRGGPVILVQMENEYNNVSRRYGEEGQKYLAWAEQLGRRAGFSVPMVMCEGASPNSIETLNGKSVWKRVESLRSRRPGQPAIWTENWVAWYDTWGEPHHTRKVDEVIVEVLRFFAAGGAGVNYYMWHGGTNFGRTAMYLGTTSYDYDAPLDEYGFPTPGSERLKVLHDLLRRHAPLILEGSRSPTKLFEQEGKEVAQCSSVVHGSNELAFVFSTAADPVIIRLLGVDLSLPANGAAVLERTGSTASIAYRSWIPSEAEPHVEFEPAGVILPWVARPEPRPTDTLWAEQFQPVALPHHMLTETRDETDYGWYRTKVTSASNRMVTLAARVSDRLSVWVNGEFVGTVPERLLENRDFSAAYSPTENDPKRFAVQIPVPLKAGENELLLLVNTLGMIKADWMIEQPMSSARQGLLSPVYLDEQVVNEPWSFVAGTVGERQQWFAPGAHDAAAWKVLGPPARLSWFETTFELTPEQIRGVPWTLDADGLGKGTFWLNGHNLGRYWQDAGPQRYYHIPTSWLTAGSNQLVIFEEELGTPEKVQLLRRHVKWQANSRAIEPAR